MALCGVEEAEGELFGFARGWLALSMHFEQGEGERGYHFVGVWWGSILSAWLSMCSGAMEMIQGELRRLYLGICPGDGFPARVALVAGRSYPRCGPPGAWRRATWSAA